MSRDGEYESFGINERMALASLHRLTYLATLEAAFPTDSGRLHRLAINDSCARPRISAQLDTERLAERRVDPFPGAGQTPCAKGVEDRLPRRQVTRQQTPSATAAHQIEDRVEDAAERMKAETSPP